ncbi:helix-turn-helix domain-containing protein [Pelagibius sp.]|uniref:MerR family transcriptional regulator n=1 Tax=Pelagibius sp. TaxID=1931238 RepID=UPI002620836E|nr:helix-turn-helix domain-containing protein [Pelagibius sp.]
MARQCSAIGIGSLSGKTGCAIETIRYYEKIGLMPRPQRSAGGHRLYEAEDVRRLSFIVRCRRLGFSTGEVRHLLSLSDAETPSCPEVQSVTEGHLAEVRRKIAELRTLEDSLARMLETCRTTQTPGCPVIKELLVDA